MKSKYVRAIKTLKRTAEHDVDARSIIEKIEEEFEEEIRDQALALAACIYLNYEKVFTTEKVAENFKDLELSKIDIVSVVELLRELVTLEVSIKDSDEE